MSSKFYTQIIVPSIGLLPLFVALFRKRNWNEGARVLFYYLCLAAVFNVIAKLTAQKNNMPYLHLYTVLEFTILCLFLRSFNKDRRSRLLFIGLIVGFALLSMWYAFVENRLFTFNEVPRFLDSLIISVFCLFYLLRDLGNSGSRLSRFKFLTLAGLLIYYSTCSALFGLSGELMKLPKNITSMMWNIHATLLLLMYLLFTAAFYSLKAQKNDR